MRPSVHGLRLVDVFRMVTMRSIRNRRVWPVWPLVVKSDRHSRKGFPFGSVLKLSTIHPEVVVTVEVWPCSPVLRGQPLADIGI